MKKFSFFKNISLIIALLVVVYFISHYAGGLKSEILKFFNIPGSSVQGTSTKRAQEISEKIQSDIGDQIDIAREQFLNVTLGDVINDLSRLQKIQHDFNSLKDYTEEKVNNVLKSEPSQKSKVKI